MAHRCLSQASPPTNLLQYFQLRVPKRNVYELETFAKLYCVTGLLRNLQSLSTHSTRTRHICFQQ